MEAVARAEFEESRDEQAFQLMVQASHRESQFFDCMRGIEARPEVANSPTPVGAEQRCLALAV